MKKEFAVKVTSLGLALLCGATFALSACGDKGEKKPDETKDPSTVIITAGTDEQAPIETIPLVTDPVEDDSVREPVDSPRAEMLVKYYYDLAMQVYNWIYVECMPITVDNGIEQDGDMYYPIVAVFETALLDNATIKTYSDLESYIRAIFEKPLADVLVADSLESYRDIDGALYCKGVDYQPEDTSDAQVTAEAFLSDMGSDHFRYTIKETTMKDGETTVVYHDYIYENTSNGWRWTAFPIV